LGDRPLSRKKARLFFRLLVHHNERGSLIVTINTGFASWGDGLNDLDRSHRDPGSVAALRAEVEHQRCAFSITEKKDSRTLQSPGRISGRRGPHRCLPLITMTGQAHRYKVDFSAR
jgi:hypothetical protein